jgi:auxin efflux carrier family
MQAALPLAVTSFVYAEEYKVHADIMSTGYFSLLNILALR